MASLTWYDTHENCQTLMPDRYSVWNRNANLEDSLQLVFVHHPGVMTSNHEMVHIWKMVCIWNYGWLLRITVRGDITVIVTIPPLTNHARLLTRTLLGYGTKTTLQGYLLVRDNRW